MVRLAPSALRLVARRSFAHRGVGFDPRPLLKEPVRALRGGPDGVAVGFGWRTGELEISVLARAGCDEETVERAFVSGRGLAAVDDDPAEFMRMVADHPLLAKLAREASPRLPRSPTLFEAFAIAVIGQLVTSWEAREAVRRLWTVAGEMIPGTRLRAAPMPGGVRDVPMWKLRAIGIGSRRATTLRDGARRGDSLEDLRSLDPAIVVDKLVSLRGVGPWTANQVALAALGWSDAVPVGDLHAPRFVTKALTGEPEGDDASMLEALAPFRPHRARVVQLLQGFEGKPPKTEPPRRLPRVDPHRRYPWRY